MHKLNKICRVIIVSVVFFEEPAAQISPFICYLISFVFGNMFANCNVQQQWQKIN